MRRFHTNIMLKRQEPCKAFRASLAMTSLTFLQPERRFAQLTLQRSVDVEDIEMTEADLRVDQERALRLRRGRAFDRRGGKALVASS